MTDLLLEMLANSLWVGTAAAAFAGLACLALRDPAARHWICFGALAASVGIPAAQTLFPQPAPPAVELPAAPILMAPATFEPTPAPWDWSLLAWSWGGGAALLAGLLILRVGRAMRAKRSSVWVSARLLERREAWRNGLVPGRDGDFLESRSARSPFAVGWFRPAVVFPKNIEDRLADGDLRRLWLHEAAHLRRWDDWSALLAEIFGTVLFFHPAVWWLRSRMAAEREFACDEAAARAAGSAAEYALTLTRFAELQLPRNLAGELGFAGGAGLSRRIQMLIDPSRKNGSKRPLWAFGLAGAALAVGLTAGPKVTLAQGSSSVEVEVSPNPAPRPAPEPAMDIPPVPPAPAAPGVSPAVPAPPAPPVAVTPVAPRVPPAPPVPPVELRSALRERTEREEALVRSIHDLKAQMELQSTPELRRQFHGLHHELKTLLAQGVEEDAPARQRRREAADRARQMAEEARRSMPDQEQMERMREQARRMAEEVQRNLPNQEQLRKIQERARAMAEQAHLAAPDPEQLRLFQEQARKMAEQARQSMPDQETMRKMQEEAERISLQTERMQESMEGFHKEMERLHEQMRPAIEEFESAMRERVEEPIEAPPAEQGGGPGPEPQFY